MPMYEMTMTHTLSLQGYSFCLRVSRNERKEQS